VIAARSRTLKASLVAAAVALMGCAACVSKGAGAVDARPGGGGAGGAGGEGGPGGGGSGGAGGMTGPLDQFGYAVVGANVNPPLLHRVKALPCQPRTGSQCMTDADCGAGRACSCGSFAANLCVPAECLTDVDCGNGVCLFSIGPDEHCCGSGSTRGLYCERLESTCKDGSDCPGNGAACVYITSANRFECRVTSCSDCF